MKTPKFFSKLSAVLSPRPKKKLQATAARAARRPVDDYDDEEPTTNLSSAFVVVLILHVVAVGGIYAFNSIKASRRGHEPLVAPIEQSAEASQKPIAQNDDAPSASAPKPQQAITTSHSTTDTAPVPAVTSSKPVGGHPYQVKAGDTLSKVAFAYNVTPAQIMEANHLKEGAVLHQGQTITIPDKKADKTADTNTSDNNTAAKQTDVPATATTPGLYTVKKGDTPTSIAHKHGLTVEELLKANKITDPKKLQVGQTLKVPPRKS